MALAFVAVCLVSWKCNSPNALLLSRCSKWTPGTKRWCEMNHWRFNGGSCGNDRFQCAPSAKDQRPVSGLSPPSGLFHLLIQLFDKNHEAKRFETGMSGGMFIRSPTAFPRFCDWTNQQNKGQDISLSSPSGVLALPGRILVMLITFAFHQRWRYDAAVPTSWRFRRARPGLCHIVTCVQSSSVPFTPHSHGILVFGLRVAWPNNFPVQRLEFIGTRGRDVYQLNVEPPKQRN
jgi:hypothetical protein